MQKINQLATTSLIIAAALVISIYTIYASESGQIGISHDVSGRGSIASVTPNPSGVQYILNGTWSFRAVSNLHTDAIFEASFTRVKTDGTDWSTIKLKNFRGTLDHSEPVNGVCKIIELHGIIDVYRGNTRIDQNEPVNILIKNEKVLELKFNTTNTYFKTDAPIYGVGNSIVC